MQVSVRIPIERVIALAEDAGRAIMEVYESADHGLELKGDDSPLTKARAALHAAQAARDAAGGGPFVGRGPWRALA